MPKVSQIAFLRPNKKLLKLQGRAVKPPDDWELLPKEEQDRILKFVHEIVAEIIQEEKQQREANNDGQGQAAGTAF
jgi:hypothetical protein